MLGKNVGNVVVVCWLVGFCWMLCELLLVCVGWLVVVFRIVFGCVVDYVYSDVWYGLGYCVGECFVCVFVLGNLVLVWYLVLLVW